MRTPHVTQAIVIRLTYATLANDIQDMNSGPVQRLNQLIHSVRHSLSRDQHHVQTTVNDAGKRGKAMRYGTHHTRTDANTRDSEVTRPHAQVEVQHIMDHLTMAVLQHLPLMRIGTMTGAAGMRINTGIIIPGKVD